jgi:RHS repeat-associated protein
MICRDVTVSGTTTRYWFQHDANFNTTSVTDDSGNVVERYVYDPYGLVTILNADGSLKTSSTLAALTRYLSQGRRLDPINATYDSRNRIYDPTIATWKQQDNGGGYVDGSNLYQFAGSNPVDWVDPLGLDRTGNNGKQRSPVTPARQPRPQPTTLPAADPNAPKTLIQVDVVPNDWSEGWIGFDGGVGNWGILASKLYSCPVSDFKADSENTIDMVDKIKVHMRYRPNSLIKDLVFRGHGNKTGFYPGSTTDVLDSVDDNIVPGSPRYSQTVADKLAELKPYMAPGATITLHSCYSGLNKKMMQALANLTGAKVTASDAGTFAGRNIVGGDWFTAYPGGGTVVRQPTAYENWKYYYDKANREHPVPPGY